MGMKDWGSKFLQAFKGSAVARPDAAAQLSVNAQVQTGMHRHQSPQEIGTLSGYLRQIKDMTQTNLLVMDSLLKAKANPAVPETEKICEQLKGLGGETWVNTETCLGECVYMATQLDTLQSRQSKILKNVQQQEHLPLVDGERDLVIGIAKMAKAAYVARSSLKKQVVSVEKFIDIPQLERIKSEWARDDAKVDILMVDMAKTTFETLGKPKADKVPELKR